MKLLIIYIVIGTFNLLLTMFFGYINSKRNSETSSARKYYDLALKLWKMSIVGKILSIVTNTLFIIYLIAFWPISLILGFMKLKKHSNGKN